MTDEVYVDFELEGGNKLYFSPTYNKFWLNTITDEVVIDYYDTSISELRIEITYLCNGNCKYCIVFGNEIEKIETLDIKESWNWLSAQEWFENIKTIFIIGGEPLLCFSEILFILDNFNGEVRISTNGTLITHEIAKKLAKHNVLIYLSLDGLHYEDNQMRIYKDGRYMYADIIKGLNNLIEEGVRYGIFMVATKDNVHSAYKIIKEIDNIFHPIRIGYSMPHWTQNYMYEITAEEYRDALIDLYLHRKEINADIMQLKWRIKPLWQGKRKKYSCALHTTQITLLADKSIVRCSKIDNDPILKTITNDKLCNGCPSSLALKEINPCASCVALSCCGGGCPFDGLKRFGGVIDKRECIITPAVVSIAINDFVSAIKNRTDLPDGLISSDIIKEILN